MILWLVYSKGKSMRDRRLQLQSTALIGTQSPHAHYIPGPYLPPSNFFLSRRSSLPLIATESTPSAQPNLSLGIPTQLLLCSTARFFPLRHSSQPSMTPCFSGSSGSKPSDLAWSRILTSRSTSSGRKTIKVPAAKRTQPYRICGGFEELALCSVVVMDNGSAFRPRG